MSQLVTITIIAIHYGGGQREKVKEMVHWMYRQCCNAWCMYVCRKWTINSRQKLILAENSEVCRIKCSPCTKIPVKTPREFQKRFFPKEKSRSADHLLSQKLSNLFFKSLEVFKNFFPVSPTSHILFSLWGIWLWDIWIFKELFGGRGIHFRKQMWGLGGLHIISKKFWPNSTPPDIILT